MTDREREVIAILDAWVLRRRQKRKRTVSVARIADALDISPRRVRQLIEEGTIRGVRIGARGNWRVLREWLDVYESELAEASAASAASARAFVHEPLE